MQISKADREAHVRVHGLRSLAGLAKRHAYVLSWTVFIAAFIFLCFTQAYNLPNVLSSDLSSEMVLGRLLSEQGGLITPDWYYATELKIFGSHIVYSLLFHLLNDWFSIHIIGSIISYVLYMGALFFFCCALKMKRWFPLVGTILLIPYSINYFYIILSGTYYICYMMQIFLILGFLFYAIRCFVDQRESWRYHLLVACGMGIAFFTGLGGLRFVVVFAAPLLFSAIIFWLSKKSELRKRVLLWCSLLMVATLLGYIMNITVLSAGIHFSKQNYMSWTSFNLERFETFFTGVLTNYGYDSSAKVFSLSTLSCISSFVILGFVIWAVIKLVKMRDWDFTIKLFALYVGCAVFALCFIYCFTNMLYGGNHSTPPLICGIILIMVLLHELRGSQNRVFEYSFVVIVTCLIIVGANYYKYWYEYETPGTSGLWEVNAFLDESGYEVGYSSYGQANVLTEMSNGDIEMLCWGPSSKEGLSSLDERYHWNQLRVYDDVTPVDENTFMLFTREEWEKKNIANEIRDKLALVFENEGFLVFKFIE